MLVYTRGRKIPWSFGMKQNTGTRKKEPCETKVHAQAKHNLISVYCKDETTVTNQRKIENSLLEGFKGLCN